VTFEKDVYVSDNCWKDPTQSKFDT
jgi:hypothetical protein